MNKTAQQLIAELTADYEMSEKQLRQALQQGNLVEGLTSSERETLEAYWNTETLSTRYLVADERYGDSQQFDSIEAVREAARELFVAFGSEGEESDFVAQFESVAKPITTENLKLVLEDENDDGVVTHRPFVVSVTYVGDAPTDQQWNRLYEFVNDEWAGSDAVYKFSCI
jgi:hypothetical protein